jgi:RPA family protein
VAASDGSVAVVGSIVDIQEGSGLIKRCPEADCTRVLSGERCAEHGAVEGEFDLRIKAIVDDGNRSINAIFDAEATATVSGLSLEDAQAMAMDALDTGVVVEALVEQVLGRPYRLTGPVVGEYFLVDDVASGSVDEDLSADALEPAVTARQPARRVLAQELNASTYTFQESDEERAPVLGLSPTGMALNRVLVVGALTEVRDVGSDSEYWQGRVYAGSEPVFVYAGQYLPGAMDALRQAETPSYVAVVGKHRSYESGGRTNVAIEPEFIIPVDEETRDAWVEETVAQTSTRIDAFEAGRAPFGERARRAYGEDMSGFVEAIEATDRTADE